MAKSERKKASSTKPQNGKSPDVPKGYEEVGDFWESMFTFESPGDFIQGKFCGTVANVGENESSVHIIEKDGERVGIWGSAVLDKRMSSVNLNADVMVVFQSLEQSEKSGREYKDFKVYAKKGTGTQRRPREDDIPF